MIELKSYADFERFIGSFTNYERQRHIAYGPEAMPLERMRSFVSELGDPLSSYPSIHIAGTKGKGSTSLMLEALLAAEGFRVGTYTSPHVEHLRERIRVGGRWIGEAELVDLARSFLPVLERRRSSGGGGFPTFFELMTALAMSRFARAPVDWGVFEVGLGGRLDATNILAPRACAITGIGLEHVAVLGDTHQRIAREKAGIIKRGIPLVAGDMPEEALREVLAAAREQGAEVVRPREGGVMPAGSGHVEIAGYGRFEAPAVRGPALRHDLAVALELHRLALEASGRRPVAARIAGALATLELPARVELFAGTPPVLLDGAHTAESFGALESTLEEIGLPRPRTAVFSLASDKRAEPILETLARIAGRFILTRADPLRSLEPAAIRARLGAGDVIDAPRAALEEALRRGEPVIVCGSMYLAGAVRGRMRERSRTVGAGA